MTLVAVTWDGLALSAMDDTTGLTRVVRTVDGWYGTADVDTHDANRELADGAVYGPKVAKAREITISGTVTGQRADLIATRDAIAARVVAKTPADLVITDPWLNQSLTAQVRATSALKHEFINDRAFRYEVVLSAADPRRYALGWQTAVIQLTGGTGTAGRTYNRTYSWNYGIGVVPGLASLTNNGNVSAPVFATYDGPLTETRLTDGTTMVHVAPLLVGEQLLIATDTLTAMAPGGASRASYIMAGSAPLLIPPASQVTWQLLGSGLGTVTLQWRAAWA
jgi:hypothetical protein